jgi:hypothetical protein
VEKGVLEKLKGLGNIFEAKGHEIEFKKAKWGWRLPFLECCLLPWVPDNIPLPDLILKKVWPHAGDRKDFGGWARGTYQVL